MHAFLLFTTAVKTKCIIIQTFMYFRMCWKYYDCYSMHITYLLTYLSQYEKHLVRFLAIWRKM